MSLQGLAEPPAAEEATVEEPSAEPPAAEEAAVEEPSGVAVMIPHYTRPPTTVSTTCDGSTTTSPVL